MDMYGDPNNSTMACMQPAGFVADSNDCDDTDGAVNPGAIEDCNDGIDNDCDGLVDQDDPDAVNCPDCIDNDGDGYGDGSGCLGPDCNDNNPNVNPAVTEVCDGIDNDCDGLIDDADPDVTGQSTWYADTDMDMYGDPNNSTMACMQPAGFVADNTDCDDNNLNVNPGATEGPFGDATCSDTLDNDCDGFTDSFDNDCSGTADNDGDGYTVADGDCDDNDPSVNPGATEICDGKDTNCDGDRSWNDYDIDEDGFAVCAGDCNDLDAALNPDADEICGDGIDNNCNNSIDEAGCICPDADGDGHPAAFCGGDDCDDTDPTIFENCPGCTDADGDGFAVEGGNCGPVDCDDTDPNVNPGAAEVCDGKDTNCDGSRPWNDYDEDGDGYALCNGECDDRPDGADGIPGTADDGANINPGMLERTIRDAICSDGLDNDCDVNIDDRDTGCFPPTCDSGPTTQDYPHFFTLLNPDDTVHPDNNSLICGKCHGAGLLDPIRGECQRCHADSSDPSDPLNGTTKDQYPLDPPYGYGTAPNVKMHSSEIVGTKNGNWTMGAQGCSVCHNPHSQEQNNVFGTDYGMFVKEYICYDNDETGDRFEEFVEFTSPTGTGSFADGPPYIENVCNMCHTMTNHHQRGGTAPGGQDHNNGADCMECHPHGDGFAPTGGVPVAPHNTQLFLDNCDYCHVTDAQGNIDFGAPIPDTNCDRCHTPNGTLKQQFPLDPPDGFGTAPDVITHQGRDCVGCHLLMTDSGNLKLVKTDLSAVGGGTNIVFTARTGENSFADGTPPYDDNVCNTCHTMTNHHRNDSSQPFPNQDHNNGQDCAGCHPHSQAFTPILPNPVSPHDSQLFLDNCDYCHVTDAQSNIDFSATIPDMKCNQCHTPDGSLKQQFPLDPPDGFGTAPDVLAHTDANGSGKYQYTNACVTCHEPMFGTTNIAHVRTDLSAAGGGTNIVFTARTGENSFADGTPPYDDNVCNTCHTMTNHHRNDSSQPFPNQDHNNGQDCAGCHPHVDAFLPPPAECIVCHNGIPGGAQYVTRDVVGVDFTRSSRHVFGGTVTNWDCIVCHREGDENAASQGDIVITSLHNNGGIPVVDMRNVDTVTSGWVWDKNNKDDAMFSDMDSFCMGCHDMDGASGINVNATDDGVNLSNARALTPFNSTDDVSEGIGGGTFSLPGYERTEVLDVHSKFDPTNPSHHAVRGQAYMGHNTNWGDGAWVDRPLKSGQGLMTLYEASQLHCADCHTVDSADSGAHGGANGFMLQAASIDDTCFLCHNPGTYNENPSNGTDSRWDHSNESNTFKPDFSALIGQYNGNAGSACMLCHGGDPAVDGYGGIHGLPYNADNCLSDPSYPNPANPDCDWRSGEPRYRFQGGSYMSHSPSSWTGTTGGEPTCYFDQNSVSQPFAQCAKHDAPETGSKTQDAEYPRGVPGDY
jgi:hypothetical protein